MSATKCEGVKWNAANGTTAVDNPVCWSNDVPFQSGKNPWVVGTPVKYNAVGYECRTKCAGVSGKSFGHCNLPEWWTFNSAKAIRCIWHSENISSGLLIHPIDVTSSMADCIF